MTAGAATTPDSRDDTTTAVETVLAELLADLLHVQRVPVDSDFFADLGADSLVLAHLCARARKRPELPPMSMKDVYRHPTIRGLATALVAATPEPSAAPPPVEVSASSTPSASAAAYVRCGALQLLFMFGYAWLVASVAGSGYRWILASSSLVEGYLRALVFGGLTVLGMCLLPIAAKWLLVGRWTARQLPIWSLGYLRFWLVRTLVRANPLVLLAGSPLYLFYLRALGAKVGRGVVILSRHVPVCTDLLTVGDGTLIRKDCYFNGYRATAGVLETGPVTLGRHVLVGEATVLDIGTALSDGAQLGHSSSLHTGQSIPNGQSWHGSPAQPSTVDHRVVGQLPCGRLRRAAYAAIQLAIALTLVVPLTFGGLLMLLRAIYHYPVAGWLVLCLGSVVLGMLLVHTLPVLLHRALRQDRMYPLYGWHYWVHRTLARVSNPPFYTHLFGDSSFIVYFLRWLGYDLSRVEQTGSNFGLDVKHENPFLSSVGSGTMVADGLSIMNADYSNTAFRLSRTSIGAHNFLGNYIAYPAHGRTGEDCLLATKVMVPLDGEVRAGVGLLGSPSFEIPRSVQRDSRFDYLKRGDGLRCRLIRKNRHNAVTIGWYLLMHWLHLGGLVVLGVNALALHPTYGALSFAVAAVLGTASSIVYFGLVERVFTARPLRPRYCSIYQTYFWWHERYWKLSTQPRVLDGTPFKNLAWRLFGVRIGRRVFDDGCVIMEKTMVAVGDGCALNEGSIIQPHSQEDGAFKSDRIVLGARVTVGVGALVHYGVAIGDDAVLAADSFLMKGEEVPAGACWAGNPAKQLHIGAAETTADLGAPAPWQR